MALFIAGTGTDIGKTIFSALIMARYGAELGLQYHKPVQTGNPTDTALVAGLTGLNKEFFIPEQYQFALAASPHFAAEAEKRSVPFDELKNGLTALAARRVLVELAGGVMVPLTRTVTNLDLMHQVGWKTVLVAATGLGTINHSLLTLTTMQRAQIDCAGIFSIGPENALYSDNARTIAEFSGVAHLGEFFLPAKKLASEEFRERARDFDPQGKIRRLFV